jgi:hypothetical protein
MSAKRQGPDPARVAWWRRMLKIHARGCLVLAPNPADPLDIAAYNEARRQLAAQAKTEARAEPEATP